jgi:hypothetical protein
MSLSADVAAWLSAGHVLCCVLFLLLLLSIGRALWFAGRRGADVPVDSSGERRSQFTIRQLIFAVFFTSLLCAAARWLGGECVAVLALWLPGSWLLWTAIAHPDQAAARLLALHLVLAIYLTFGPILAYHVNGRAWYDYGLAGWNPPVSQDDTGKTWKADYDPKFTPPATWPIVGPAMYAMSYFSPILVVCPPTAPLVAMVSLFLLWRAPVRRTRFLI